MKTRLIRGCVLLVLCYASTVPAAPTYSIATLGFTGSEHTRDDGYKFTSPFYLNEAGQASGISFSYNGGNDSVGRSAWLYDGATSIDIGLSGVEHTRNDGYKYSSPAASGIGAVSLNEAGQVSGFSKRYSGGSLDLATVFGFTMGQPQSTSALSAMNTPKATVPRAVLSGN